MSTISDLTNVNVDKKVNLDIYVDQLQANNSSSAVAYIDSANYPFTNNKSFIIITGSSYNPTAQILLNNLLHHSQASNISINLPSVNSVYNYLNSTYNISLPPSVGFTFSFKVVNKSVANQITITGNADPNWILSHSVGYTTIPIEGVIIPAATTRVYTCRCNGAIIQVFG